MNSRSISFLVVFILLLASCSDEKPHPQTPPSGTKHLYVLNEGLFSMNNSSLTLFDQESRAAFTDFFEQTNGRRLGDTGNDMAVCGSKLYIVLSGSSQVEVLEAATGKSLRQIPLFDGQRARQPRAVAFWGRKAYVACLDGMVVAIDTASLQVEAMVRAGLNPDGIAASAGKLYVSNSGGLNFPHYDSTVSVIDAASLTEIRRINVGINPGAIATDPRGEVYVVRRGNYGNVPPALVVISPTTDAVKLSVQIPVLQLFIYGDTAWLTHIDYSGSMQSSIALWDTKNETLLSNQFITDGTMPETVYGIYADRPRGLVFIADARSFVNTGMVHAYDLQGKKQFSFPAGLNPSKMAAK